MYFISLVDFIPVKRANPRSEGRRKGTFIYHIKTDNQRMQVCKGMFLKMFSLGEWSVHNWVINSDSGIQKLSKITERQNKKRDKQFVELFLVYRNCCLIMLGKIQQNCTWMLLIIHINNYMIYIKISVNLQSKESVSEYTFHCFVKKLNIFIFQPRKDQCDICCAYS